MAQQQAPKHLPSRERGNSPPLVKFLNLGNGEPKGEVGAKEDGDLRLLGNVQELKLDCELGALCWTSEAGCSGEAPGGWAIQRGRRKTGSSEWFPER